MGSEMCIRDSKNLRASLRSTLAVSPLSSGDPWVTVLLPGISHEELRRFLDSLYDLMAGGQDNENNDYFDVGAELGEGLDLRILPGMRDWEKEELDEMKQQVRSSL